MEMVQGSAVSSIRTGLEKILHRQHGEKMAILQHEGTQMAVPKHGVGGGMAIHSHERKKNGNSITWKKHGNSTVANKEVWNCHFFQQDFKLC